MEVTVTLDQIFEKSFNHIDCMQELETICEALAFASSLEKRVIMEWWQ